MRDDYKKVGFLSLAVLISIGLVGCNFDDNNSLKTGTTMTGSNFGSAAIIDDSGSDNEADDTSNDNADFDGGDDTSNDGEDSDGGASIADDSDNTDEGDDSTNDTNDTDNTDEGDTDDNGNLDGENGGGAGTAGCVAYPRPVAGQKIKIAAKDGTGTTQVITEFSTIEVSDTSLTEEVTISAAGVDFSSTLTKVLTFTIADNYLDITQVNTTTISPYERRAIDTVCEGQIWTQIYTETDGASIESITRTSTIEAVNVPKTTAAGTFNTFRLLEEDNIETTTSWIDIATGALVFGETEGEDSVVELIEIN